MKKITLVLLVMLSAFTMTNAQIDGNCQKTCEIETVVQEGALLGVKIINIRQTETNQGVYVKQVMPNTAAEKFNFQYKDILISVDGQEVATTKEMVALIASYEPSDLVTVVYKRNGKEIEQDVVLGARSTKIVKSTICCDDNDKFFNDVNMTVFPNPAVNSISLNMENAEAGKYTFQVFNTIGAEVYVAVDNFDASFTKSIDLSEFSSGEYFLRISKGNTAFTKTFIVSK